MKIIKVNTHRDGGSKQLDIQIDNYIVQVQFKRVRQTESEIAHYQYPKLKFKDKKLSFENNQFGLTVDKLKELITDYKDFLEMKSDLKQELIKTISIK